jgi:hypothetical protein
LTVEAFMVVRPGAGAIAFVAALPLCFATPAPRDIASAAATPDPPRATAPALNALALMQAAQRCTLFDEDDVTIVPHGFLIEALDAFVPQDEARPSADDHYWYCITPGRAFFVPPKFY